MYRELVIDAAERVFASRGYAGTRMQDVADEAGLAIATVYATIAGKEELYAAIHERNGRVLLARARPRRRRARARRSRRCSAGSRRTSASSPSTPTTCAST